MCQQRSRESQEILKFVKFANFLWGTCQFLRYLFNSFLWVYFCRSYGISFFFIPVFLILSVYPKLKRTEYIIGKDSANYSNPWTFKALKSSVSCRLKYFENQAMAVGVLGKKVCPEVE